MTKEEAYRILRRPLITEKSTELKELYNKITFEVDRRANKIQIRKAVEIIFNVSVEDVRTINLKGKKVRMGRYEGELSDWKKAIVTLKPGQKVEFFEGV